MYRKELFYSPFLKVTCHLVSFGTDKDQLTLIEEMWDILAVLNEERFMKGYRPAIETMFTY